MFEALLPLMVIVMALAGAAAVLIFAVHLHKRRLLLESEMGKELTEARKKAQELQYADWRVRQVESFVRDEIAVKGESLDRAMLLSIINRQPSLKEIDQ